jgi:hypothetical protein
MMAGVGLLMESLADIQKLVWHRKHVEGRPGKESTTPPVCSSGVWSLSRHPNLFSEILFHFGVYTVAAPVLPPWVVAFPSMLALQIIFLRGGVVNQEQQRNYAFSFYTSYIAYRDSTSPLWPMPQSVWKVIPPALKSTVFLELNNKYTEYDRELVGEMDAMKKGMRQKVPLSTIGEQPESPIHGVVLASEA